MSAEADAVRLAELQDAILDRETLGRLFFDLSQLAVIVEVRIKGGTAQHASGASATLDDARAMMESGTALGVQIRYRLGSAEWIDTLLRTTGERVRLVRIQVPGVAT